MDEKLAEFLSLGVCGGCISAPQSLGEGDTMARGEGRREEMAHLERSQRF